MNSLSSLFQDAERFNWEVWAADVLRLEAGACAHRRVGRRTDLRRASEQFKLVLLVVWLLAAAAALVATAGGL